MQWEQKTSVDTTQIAICVANMLNDYLIKEQQIIKTEDKNNDSTQNSEPSYIKTSLCLFETVNNGQVKLNQESTERQLGTSGSQTGNREDFKILVADVSMLTITHKYKWT